MRPNPATSPSFALVSQLGSWLSLAPALLAVAVLAGCTFGGYVPKGQHRPVADAERNIADLPFSKPTTGRLECAEGLCRVRHRLRVGEPGHVKVVVQGPRGLPDGAGGLTGPRLARAFLQDVNGQELGRNDPDVEEGPMVFSGDVSQAGPLFVLIQGLGGGFGYEVTATFEPSGALAQAPTSNTGVPGLHDPNRGGSEAKPRAVPGTVPQGKHRPGDVTDGADFAFDPTADTSLWRKYAFAENPQAQLDGEVTEDRGDPFVIRRIQRMIRYELADAGLNQVDASEADFLISVQVGSQATTWYSVSSMPRTTSYDAYFDRWRGFGAFINPHTYVDGTLVIDFVDPKSGDLVWHGWTTEPVNVKIDDEELLKAAVRTVLEQFSER